MSFIDTLKRYRDNKLEHLTHETSYHHKFRGTIYQKRRQYFIKKNSDLTVKLNTWGLSTIYEYKGQRTFGTSKILLANSSFILTTNDGDIDQVQAFIEWKTDCKVILIKRRIIEIGIIRS
jgi:hypothetical protein